MSRLHVHNTAASWAIPTMTENVCIEFIFIFCLFNQFPSWLQHWHLIFYLWFVTNLNTALHLDDHRNILEFVTPSLNCSKLKSLHLFTDVTFPSRALSDVHSPSSNPAQHFEKQIALHNSLLSICHGFHFHIL